MRTISIAGDILEIEGTCGWLISVRKRDYAHLTGKIDTCTTQSVSGKKVLNVVYDYVVDNSGKIFEEGVTGFLV